MGKMSRDCSEQCLIRITKKYFVSSFNYMRIPFHVHSPRGITTSLVKSTAVPVCETHDAKNARLKRPMSPHLTIYKFQLTSMLSITHRASGMILAGYGMTFAYGKKKSEEDFSDSYKHKTFEYILGHFDPNNFLSPFVWNLMAMTVLAFNFRFDQKIN